MPSIDLVVETKCSASVRARQLEAIFDCPRQEMSRIEFKGDLPIEGTDWNVGLIVGPSGCGKSTVLRGVFGAERIMEWRGDSVIDDFDASLTMQQIAEACQSVGFNTIPAWMRPHAVLSNGEKFRVELARRLLESDDIIVVDEFTSVVDRQVAQIGSHAVQKYVRRADRKFVAASCHYDIIDWLQPDWTFEPATMQFTRRSLQRRPSIDCEIRRVSWDSWRVFAPFHYLTAGLNRSARCFVLFIAGRPAAFAGVLMMPHPKVRNIRAVSRLVTLPDFQGLGLAFALVDRLGAAYAATGRRLRTYPAHPSLIRGFDLSPAWRLEKKPGRFSSMSSSARNRKGSTGPNGGRPCAVFEFCGAAADDKRTAATMVA